MAHLSVPQHTRKKGCAMRRPINGLVLALLIIVCLIGMGFSLLKTRALSTVQAKLSALLTSSASEAPDTASFLSQLPASSGGSVEGARQDDGFSPHLSVKQINQERGFNHHDVPSVGAAGITQFMPAIAPGLGIDPKEQVQSLRGASQLMSRSPLNYRRDDAKSLATYHGGTGMLRATIAGCGAW
jgi:Transglycosylase SLT domain